MDLVPLDFCKRVAAAWKCCEDGRLGCRCVTPVFSTRNWTFPKATIATFVVLPDARGEWRYNFRLESDMTMGELLEHPDSKNIQVDSIEIDGLYSADRLKPVSDVGMKKLLNFVSFLANEPGISIISEDTSVFGSPEGAMLLSWLEQRWFRRIGLITYFSAYNRLLQKQFARRIPTNIFVHRVIGDAQFFADQLRSGQMTRFQADRCVFSSDVMQGIIESFLRSPSEKKIDIAVYFDDSTESLLIEMAERRFCRRIDGKFIFENRFHRLQVWKASNAPPGSFWKCVTLKSE